MEVPTYLDETAPMARTPMAFIGQTISKTLFYPFAAVRKLMTLEGVLDVKLGANDRAKLDTAGHFSKDAKGRENLVEMGTIDY
jgi:hypothetical protein